MFKDYYAILEVAPTSSKEDILIAFRKQAMKWHPDRNPGVDTTEKMQFIIEAKLILSDEQARKKYDLEYSRYKERYRAEGSFTYQGTDERYSQNAEANSRSTEQDWRESFEAHDEDLKRWMHNAQKQSKDLLQKTLEDFKGMVKVGAKAALEAGVQAFLAQIVISILFMIIILIAGPCN